jgi:opacity protein-like surface antigen
MKQFILALLLIPGLAEAQRWHVNVTGGVSNYSGDLQSKAFTLDQSEFAFGAGAQYDLSPHVALLSTLSLMQVGAEDRFNKPDLQFRNLSFQTKIEELNLVGEYSFFDLHRSAISPYLFGGVAVFHFNPYAYDSSGNKVFLRPLSTEGEGLKEYPGQKPYSLIQFAIPFGAGVKFRVTENIVLSYEIGVRKTFTDYIDDVSTRYVDKTILLAEKGPKAVEMAYRAGELKGGNPVYPAAGTTRGGSQYKDLYYYTGLRVSVALISRKSPYYGRGRTDCPRPVQ